MHFSIVITEFLAIDMLNVLSSNLYLKLTSSPDPTVFHLSDADFEAAVQMINRLNITVGADHEILENKIPLAKIIAINLFYFYLNTQYCDTERYPDWLQAFLKKMHEPECVYMQVHELVQFSHFSYSQLRRLFKQYLHQNLSEYFLHIKLEYAKNLLVTTNYSILFICNEIGFSSLSYFNTAFKKQFAFTPYQYRVHFASSRPVSTLST